MRLQCIRRTFFIRLMKPGCLLCTEDDKHAHAEDAPEAQTRCHSVQDAPSGVRSVGPVSSEGELLLARDCGKVRCYNFRQNADRATRGETYFIILLCSPSGMFSCIKLFEIFERLYFVDPRA